MSTQFDTNNISVEIRKIRKLVEHMLTVIENPDSTANDIHRACSTIRDAFTQYEDPSLFGQNLAEIELRAAAKNRSDDRIALQLDSQEGAFATKLRELMKVRAVTQAELASRIGCTQPAISQMVNRKCRPQRNTILRLADALNVDPREIWPDLDVTGILDTIAAVQHEGTMSAPEAEVFRRAVEGPAAQAPAAPMPKRKS